jgi:hypothetical protein
MKASELNLGCHVNCEVKYTEELKIGEYASLGIHFKK